MSNAISCPAISSFRRGYGGKENSIERQGDVGWGVSRGPTHRVLRYTEDGRPVYQSLKTAKREFSTDLHFETFRKALTNES